MTPTEPQPNQQESGDSPVVRPRRDTQTKWVLTAEALQQLLYHFSPEPEQAAKLYESMHLKLTRYFEWHSSVSAERDVDETFDRVARRISEGEKIFNLSAYFSSVARLVLMESLRERQRMETLEDAPEIAAEPPAEDDQKEARSQCLDECLDKLPVESRRLIMEYHSEEKRAKIDRRKQLANALGIPLNALRIRAHRIRLNLEECVGNCLTSFSDPGNGISSASL